MIFHMVIQLTPLLFIEVILSLLLCGFSCIISQVTIYVDLFLGSLPLVYLSVPILCHVLLTVVS